MGGRRYSAAVGAAMEVRDPLHGGVSIGTAELAIVDHPFVQRLRGIKQMGFSELPFPGAVHTRYAHSVGAMELAARAFDAVFRRDPLSADARARFRQIVRIAALCHDLGHAPFSHCTEFAMPRLRDLRVRAYRAGAVADRMDQAASHEDYTVAILEGSDLAEAVARSMPFSGRHVAALVSREVEVEDDFFVDQGQDYRRVLSQLVSSELDVDRLDYLVRDSYYSGARYGQVDVNWLLGNLEWHADGEGSVSLALDGRALYAFDDFMISRYHMFVMVYFHHKSVVYEEMLKQHFRSPERAWEFPTDVGAYLHVDDVAMFAYLRGRQDEWARRIVERRPWRRAYEVHGGVEEVDVSRVVEALEGEGIGTLVAASTGTLSRYAAMGKKRESSPPIYVLQRGPGRRESATTLQEATRVFERYQGSRHIARVYVREDLVERAEVLARGVS
jgi:HD superfamily phosphohydrolase